MILKGRRKNVFLLVAVTRVRGRKGIYDMMKMMISLETFKQETSTDTVKNKLLGNKGIYGRGEKRK